MKHNRIVSFILVALLLAAVCSVAISAVTEEQLLLADTSTDVVISTAGQPVCYRFVPEHSCVYTFHSISEEDTYAELYDADGTLLYENDDYYGLNFGIECLLEAGKEYTIFVYFLDTLSTGNFELITTTDHDVISTLTKPADCMEEGLWTRRCTICSYSWTEVIPAEHNYVEGICGDCGKAVALGGSCGETLYWNFDGATKVLTISGSGMMYDYDEDTPPWEEVSTLVAQLDLADGVTYVGINAFSGLESLTTVNIPSSVYEIADNGFSYCVSLKEIVLPEGVNLLGTYCFANCSQLRDVRISSTVTLIGSGAFQGCRSLREIWVDENNFCYSNDICGALFDKEQNRLIQLPSAYMGPYSIPDTVTVIGEAAFEGCRQLSALNIPDSVTDIESYALSNCDSLVFLRIPKNVQVIGASAINQCPELGGILFEGNAPAADGAIFDEISATVYYSAADNTWTDTVMAQLGQEVIWTPLSELTVLAQPRTVEELIGNVVTFTVGAYGNDLQYSWWSALPETDVFTCTGIEEDTYTLKVTRENLGQRLYCVITDNTGATIQTETVTVCMIPELNEDELKTVRVNADTTSQRLSFSPDYSCTYTLTSFGDNDVYCELYDADYTLVEIGDDGADHNFSLRTFLEAGKSYIFSVGVHDHTAGMVQVQLKANHEYVTTVIAPTCTTEGYTEYVCACGEGYTSDFTMPLEHKYTITRNDPTCTESGSLYTVCTGCGDSKVTVLIATGHSFTEGVCSKCGVADPNSGVTQPILTLKAPTLEFKDMITINAFFTAENTKDVVEMGMITYAEKVPQWCIETAQHVIPGTTYDTSSGRYIATSQGIHAKYLGDTVYLAVYAKLTDGSCVYSKLAGYSPVQYATSKLNGTDIKLKQLVVAMLNYGAAAQVHFGHNVDSLANSTLTNEQTALPELYRTDMVHTVASPSLEKQGIFANNKGFAKRYPSISFEGAFCINYFFTPYYLPESGITLYYWNVEDYNAVDVLATSNATGKIIMEGSDAGEYRGDLIGISAKALSEAVYVAAAYKSGGAVWTSGVLGYSIGSYCSSQATKGGTIADLAMDTAVYGYHAKQYFE